MWKIFGEKCVKFVAFCILQNFTSTDADALIWLLTFQILSANWVKLTQPITSLSNWFPKPSLSPTPWSKGLSVASYTHCHRHHPINGGAFFSFFDRPTLILLKPKPKCVDLFHSKCHRHKRWWFPFQSSW